MEGKAYFDAGQKEPTAIRPREVSHANRPPRIGQRDSALDTFLLNHLIGSHEGGNTEQRRLDCFQGSAVMRE